MSVSVPFVDYSATSVRPGWSQLPQVVRAAVAERIGEVTSVAVAGGGFTPAFAATLTAADGYRYFVKAADLSTEFGAANQRETAVLQALPAGLPVPTLVWSAVADGWAILCLEALDGYMPGHPWTDSDLRAVLAAQTQIAEALMVPSAQLRQAVNERSFAEHCRSFCNIWSSVGDKTIPLPANAPPWAQAHLDELASLESLVPQATEGATGIMHFDLRADNIMIADRAVILDWNWARPGPAAADTVMLLQTAFGHQDIDALLREHPTTSAVDTDVIDGILAALGGLMTIAGGREPIPTSPWLRLHQKAQGLRALAWLAHRRKWAIPATGTPFA